ncbi:MAG: phospho-N-acetylmuramoyl-pentapeptide-transferase [Planctomycetota bacterium]
MLSHLIESPLPRAALAASCSLGGTLLLIPRLAAWARQKGLGDREGKSHSETLNALHAHKQRTPIVGGIAMLLAAIPATLLWAAPRPEVLLLVATLVGLGLLGLADDLRKTFGEVRTEGLTPRQKLAVQGLAGAGVGAALLGLAWAAGGDAALVAQTRLALPFVGGAVTLGVVAYLLFATLLITGSSNAVNLTDGLDGLAGGCALVAFGFYAAVAGLAGDAALAGRLGLVHVPGAGEVGVALAALSGALAGFLCFNRAPAQVFMGDTGSLPLGGGLAVAALLTKQELLLALVGGVFVVEALSVIAQVASFKLTGKRVLRCAPLHHHFQFQGWQEGLVVNRFHAAALILAAAALHGLVVA